MVSPDIVAQLEQLNLGSSTPGGSVPSKGKSKVSREFFEQMQSKTLIVNWMIEHMDRADLVKCIQKGALSQADIKEAEDLAGLSVPNMSGEYSDSESDSDSDLEALKIAKDLPPKEV